MPTPGGVACFDPRPRVGATPQVSVMCERSPRFAQPVYGTPEDLVMVDLAGQYPELRGLRLRGKLNGRRLEPYYSRGEIGAAEEAEIPIDLAVSFSDLPGLADVIRRAADRQPLAYHLEGTIGVDAGQLGQPTFGPMTLLRGEMRGQ